MKIMQTGSYGSPYPATKRGEALHGGLIKLRHGLSLLPPCGNCGHQRYFPCRCVKAKGKGGTQPNG